MKFNNFRICPIKDPDSWYKLFSLFEDANIYQTWNYAAVAQNEKHIDHLAFYDNDELVGIAQVRVKTVPLINKGIAYIYSGPLWRRKNLHNPFSNFLEIVNALRNEYVLSKKLILRFRPFIFSDEAESLKINPQDLQELGCVRLSKTYNSLLLNLDDNLESLNKKLRPRWRNYLNQSVRNNLTISESYDTDSYNIFLNLYNQMRERKEFREYVNPVKIGDLNKQLPDEYKLKIFLAFQNETPLAGLVGTAIGRTSNYLLGATNTLGLELRASYLLHWKMIEWMKSMHCSRYDLGGINKVRNPGGFKFKSGMSNLEISDIGIFENSSSFLSNLIVTIGEKFRK